MTIEEARKKIDELDQQIVDLFYERMNTSCEIAKVKAAEGLDIYNPVREREILDKLAAQHEDMELYTSRLYRTIFELSRGYQRQFVKAPAKIREQIEQLRGHRELGLPERAGIDYSRETPLEKRYRKMKKRLNACRAAVVVVSLAALSLLALLLCF